MTELQDVLTPADVAAFDPASYPVRMLVTPAATDDADDADILISTLWLPTPWAPATISGLRVTMALGGGVLLMAPDQPTMDLMAAALRTLMIRPVADR